MATETRRRTFTTTRALTSQDRHALALRLSRIRTGKVYDAVPYKALPQRDYRWVFDEGNDWLLVFMGEGTDSECREFYIEYRYWQQYPEKQDRFEDWIYHALQDIITRD